MNIRCLRHAVAALVACSLAAPVLSQTLDLIPHQKTANVSKAARAEVENSIYHVGPFFLTPVITLRDAGYNANVYGSSTDPKGDYTATVGAGFRYTAPVGNRVYLRGQLVPEYVWYMDTPDRTDFGGTYSAGLTTLLSRAYVEAGAEKRMTLDVVSSESEHVANIDRQIASARAEVDVFARLAFFGGIGRAGYAYEARGDEATAGFDVRELDRTEDSWRAGVRYKITSYFDVSASREVARSDFDLDPLARNNETAAWMGGIHYTLPRLTVNIDAGQSNGQGYDSGSTFPEYRELVGSYDVGVVLARPVELRAYGKHHVIPGLWADNAWFLESRNGLSTRVRIGRRASVRVFGESGANDYSISSGAAATRNDDVTAYGGDVTLRVYRKFAIVLGADRTIYDANIQGYDRTVNRITTGITFTPGDLK